MMVNNMTKQDEIEAKFGGPEDLLMNPVLSGLMFEGKYYNQLGNGFTDRLCLVGHSNLQLHDLYTPTDMGLALSALGENTDSPMVRGLLEAYYSGSRDISIWTAAPSNEYVEDLSLRLESGSGRGTTAWADLGIADLYDQVNTLRNSRGAPNLTAPNEAEWDAYNFYERYAKRLEVAYEFLLGYDTIDTITPLHAPFYGAGDVDFLVPLAQHCRDAHTATGAVRIGIIGTAYDSVTEDIVVAMTTDSRLDSFNIEQEMFSSSEVYPGGQSGNSGKYVMVVAGNALFSFPEITVTHSGPVNAAVAGGMGRLPLNRGITHERLACVATVSGQDFNRDQVKRMCDAKLNPLIKTTRSRRGQLYTCVIATDNTLGKDGTDYWTGVTVRLVQHCLGDIRAIGNRSIGTIEFDELKHDVAGYLLSLAKDDLIRDFQLNITRRSFTVDPNRTVAVEVALRPYFGTRAIYFTAEVGNGNR